MSSNQPIKMSYSGALMANTCQKCSKKPCTCDKNTNNMQSKENPPKRLKRAPVLSYTPEPINKLNHVDSSNYMDTLEYNTSQSQ